MMFTTFRSIVRLASTDALGRTHVVEFGIPAEVTPAQILEARHRRADPTIEDAGGDPLLWSAVLEYRRADQRLRALCQVTPSDPADPFAGCQSLAGSPGAAPSELLRAIVRGSHDIFLCCREAAHVASGLRRVVAFQFCDREVVVKPGADPNAVARDWCGETPEQSRARR